MYPPGQRQSITMLGRKASTTLEHSLLQSEYLEEVSQEGGETERLTRQTVRRFFQFVSLLSLVSVSANTPQTFETYPAIKIFTYIADWFCLVSFSLEAVIKVKKRGLLTPETGYMRTRWGKFDIVMLALIAVSVVMHTFELFGYEHTAFNLSRSPRPFIMVRYIRTSFKFSMPKARLNQIFKRSSQQIYNVTLFFVFFWVLYGLLGVQFFGELHSHCVRNNTNVLIAEDVTVNDLTIPDTYCSIKSEPTNPYGLRCREGFRCMNLANRSKGAKEIGFTGFGEFATSVFTVYQAASQEGWVYIMYRATDSLDPWKSSFYFVSMIFFLAWMVKNVFIAVITETFNEIRVQFQQVWGERENLTGSSTQQVLRGDNRKWNLVTVDEFRQKGLAPKFCHAIIKHPAFHVMVMTVTVANAIVTATISFRHTRNQTPREEFFQHHRKLEIGFVIFYNVEALFKIFCLSFRGYISRTIHKFEFLLCLMTTIHIFPRLFLTPISIFQVLRVCRLIKASPMLEEFVYKIFRPGKKLSSLVIFTIHLLLITSSIAMQLFCNLKDDKTDKFYLNFSTFPYALMSMFQILTQEAWPEVMQKTMTLSIDWITPLVAFFFIFYHLFVTLIVMSLFVAVILDNLELDEEAKKVKQLKIREDSSDVKEDLPLRLRVFEKFPQRPLMAKLNKTSSDYVVPKIRESFMSKFIYPQQTEEFLMNNDTSEAWLQPCLSDPSFLRYRKNNAGNYLSNPVPMLHNKEFVKKCQVSQIIQSVRRSVRGGSQIFNKRTGTYRINENMKENGHIGLPPSATTSKANQENNPTNRPQNLDIKLIQAKQQQAEMRRNRKEEDLRENHPYFDCPLLLVPRESKFRKICQTIVNARYDAHLWNSQTGKERKVKLKTFHKLLGLVPYLDWTMIIITTISTIFQLLETPEYRVMNNPTLQVSDYLFVTAMAIELIIKLLAEGLVFTPKALLRDMSGILDMIIFSVNLTWLVWMPENITQNSVAHTLMILRCFRPLRIFILVPHMRQVVSELFRGFKEIFLVAILVIALIFVFANWGVHLFGLRFAACNDLEITNRSDCHGVYSAKVFVTKMNIPVRGQHPALIVPRVFKNPRRFNFDNIGNAMLALFEVLSYKGWVDLRDVIIHKQGVIAGIYIHLYIFLGSMIGLTLFVGVVIANYRENKGTALLTVDQMRWSDLKKRLKIAQPLHVPPKPECNILQAGIYDVVQHDYFKNLIAFLVLVNSGLLCVNWQEELKTRGYIAQLCSTLTSMFVIEICMKMIAYTPQGYFHSHRNKMDLVVTVLGVIWIILYQSFGSESEFVIVFGYISIILRFIISVPGKHATLSMLMQTVAVSVYKSFFIIMSMFILIMCYALVGVILFGTLKHGEAINRQANFESSGRGMLLLFRIVTGEDWNRVLHDCMQKPPACRYDPDKNFWQTDCGNFNWAILFFCSFYVIITYISLNLLVAIIMENFSLFYSNEEDALLSYADIRNFQITWNLVDVNQKGTIPVRRVKYILRLLKGRLEVDTQKERLLFKHMCYELERLHNGEDVTFHDVLSMLSYRSVDIRKALQIEELLAREELEYIIEEEVAKLTIRKWLDSCLKRIREKEQSLLASLKLMNEPVLNLLRPVNEDREEDTAEEVETEGTEEPSSSEVKAGGYGRADSVLSGAADRRFLTPSGAGASLEGEWSQPGKTRERRPTSRARLDGGDGSCSPLLSDLASPGPGQHQHQDRSVATNKYAQSVEEVKVWWRQQLLDHSEDSD